MPNGLNPQSTTDLNTPTDVPHEMLEKIAVRFKLTNMKSINE